MGTEFRRYQTFAKQSGLNQPTTALTRQSPIYSALGGARQAKEENAWALRLNADIRGNVEGAFTPRKRLVK